MLNSNLAWKDSDDFGESCALLAWITAHGLQGSPPWGTAMEGLMLSGSSGVVGGVQTTDTRDFLLGKDLLGYSQAAQS